uniref:Uncharacterized protein n=1 Tax=Glossina brevipalpis TaxID=37001 RepID=A0A1A9WT36_9MUSC
MDKELINLDQLVTQICELKPGLEKVKKVEDIRKILQLQLRDSTPTVKLTNLGPEVISSHVRRYKLNHSLGEATDFQSTDPSDEEPLIHWFKRAKKKMKYNKTNAVCVTKAINSAANEYEAENIAEKVDTPSSTKIKITPHRVVNYISLEDVDFARSIFMSRGNEARELIKSTASHRKISPRKQNNTQSGIYSDGNNLFQESIAQCTDEEELLDCFETITSDPNFAENGITTYQFANINDSYNNSDRIYTSSHNTEQPSCSQYCNNNGTLTKEQLKRLASDENLRQISNKKRRSEDISTSIMKAELTEFVKFNDDSSNPSTALQIATPLVTSSPVVTSIETVATYWIKNRDTFQPMPNYIFNMNLTAIESAGPLQQIITVIDENGNNTNINIVNVNGNAVYLPLFVQSSTQTITYLNQEDFVPQLNDQTIIMQSRAGTHLLDHSNNILPDQSDHSNNTPADLSDYSNDTPWDLSDHSNNNPPDQSDHSNDIPPDQSDHSNNTPLDLSDHSNNTPPNLSDHSNNIPPDQSGHSNNIPPNLSDHSNDIPTDLSGNSNNIPPDQSDHSNNTPLDLSDHSNNILPNLSDHSNNTPSNLSDHSNDIPTDLSGHSNDTSLDLSVNSIMGNSTNNSPMQLGNVQDDIVPLDLSMSSNANRAPDVNSSDFISCLNDCNNLNCKPQNTNIDGQASFKAGLDMPSLEFDFDEFNNLLAQTSSHQNIVEETQLSLTSTPNKNCIHISLNNDENEITSSNDSSSTLRGTVDQVELNFNQKQQNLSQYEDKMTTEQNLINTVDINKEIFENVEPNIGIDGMNTALKSIDAKCSTYNQNTQSIDLNKSDLNKENVRVSRLTLTIGDEFENNISLTPCKGGIQTQECFTDIACPSGEDENIRNSIANNEKSNESNASVFNHQQKKTDEAEKFVLLENEYNDDTNANNDNEIKDRPSSDREIYANQSPKETNNGKYKTLFE